MAARKIRSAVARLVVVAGLAVALLVGSVAVGQPTDASAARYTCAQAFAISDAYASVGRAFFAQGNSIMGSYWFGKSIAMIRAC